MDVELPDGTVVQDVPDGISKADLVAKLKANGMQVPDEWLGQQQQPSALDNIAHGALGALELGGAAVGNLIPGAINGVADIASRAFGNGPAKPAPTFSVGQAGQDVLGAAGRAANATGIPQAVGRGIDAVDRMLGNGPYADLIRDLAKNTKDVGQDVLDVLPAAGAGGKIAEALSKSASAREALPVWRLAGFKSPDAAAAYAAGFRNGAGQDLAAAASGGTARKILTNNNVEVGNVIARHAAGLPQDANVPLNYQTLDAALAGPESVYQRVAASVPNGDEILQQLREARYDGFKGLNSDDPESIAKGRELLAKADKLEEYLEKRIPPDSGTSIEQFRAARQAIAQNRAVYEALRGEDLDLGALGRMYRNAPNKFSGGLKIAAQFAEDNRAVTGRRIDLSDTSLRAMADSVERVPQLQKPTTWIGVAKYTRLPQRALLSGGGAEAARRMFPGRAPDAFAPLPLQLTAPPGRARRVVQKQAEMELPQAPLPAPPVLSPTPGPAFENYQRPLPFPMPEAEGPSL